MGSLNNLSLAAAFAVLLFGGATARAQQAGGKVSKAAAGKTSKAAGGEASKAASAGLSSARAALVEATEQYKAGTREMIRLKEAEIARAAETHAQLKQLAADGLLARRELEESERALAEKRAGLEGLHKQIVDSDHLIAEVRAAEEAEELAREAAKKQAAELAALKSRLQRTAKLSMGSVVIRHTGGAGWTLANISDVQSFFYNAFGRPLPTSAVGQTATHDRLGFDHRRAVDVALHPDSAEGRALIGYLQSRGITFIAFRAAVPGSATGPHIHIGPPSGRI